MVEFYCSPRGRRHSAAPLLVVLALAGAAACASRTGSRQVTRHAPLYPYEGFGRIGCFAGPGLNQFYNGPNERTDSVARVGPWLVLDSLRQDEAEQLQPRPLLDSAAYLQGTLIFDDDSTTIIGRWWRPTSDSIVLAEHRSHPPVSWYLRWQGNDLVGEARLRSDMSILLPNGRRFSPTHAWSVDLMRVSCGVVPTRRRSRVVRPEEALAALRASPPTD